MKRQYDFSKAERGKFYRAGATLQLPVYLDRKIQDRLTVRAADCGLPLTELVNRILKKEISITGERK